MTNIAVNENTTIPYTSSFTFKGIKTGTATITVAAQDGSGVKATCKVTVSNGAVTTAPSLSGSASGDTISLTWNAVTNATHYDLYFVDQYGTDVKEPIRGIKGTSWSGNGYANGTYYFQVAAVGTTDIQDNWKHSKIVKVIVTGSSVTSDTISKKIADIMEREKNNYDTNSKGSKYTGSSGYVAWCAYFAKYCLEEAGVKDNTLYFSANATYWATNLVDSGVFHMTMKGLSSWQSNSNSSYHVENLVYESGFIPRVGDVIFVENAGTSGDGPDHVAMVWKTLSETKFQSIEGNVGHSTVNGGTIKSYTYEWNSNKGRWECNDYTAFVTGFGRFF